MPKSTGNFIHCPKCNMLFDKKYSKGKKDRRCENCRGGGAAYWSPPAAGSNTVYNAYY